jgi:hypothetical protein
MNGDHRSAICWCIAVAILTQGCSKEAPPPIVAAQGVVLLNGAPLATAQVHFIPQIKFGPEFIATGVTDAQGRYSLTCNGQPGACAVDNMVTVSEAGIPSKLQSEKAQRELAVYLQSLKNRPIPQNYGSPVTTPLSVKVTEGQSEYKLELKR